MPRPEIEVVDEALLVGPGGWPAGRGRLVALDGAGLHAAIAGDDGTAHFFSRAGGGWTHDSSWRSPAAHDVLGSIDMDSLRLLSGETERDLPPSTTTATELLVARELRRSSRVGALVDRVVVQSIVGAALVGAFVPLQLALWFDVPRTICGVAGCEVLPRGPELSVAEALVPLTGTLLSSLFTLVIGDAMGGRGMVVPCSWAPA